MKKTNLGLSLVNPAISHLHVQGGSVPGGHNVIYKGMGKPFITRMKECNSIPLLYTDVVVDIGAYVGTYAIRCARFPVRKVIAYEPTPDTFEILSLTSLPNLIAVQAAVTVDNHSQVELFISSGIGVTNSTTLYRKKVKSVFVAAIPYEEATRGATIVKIDVEGAEYSYPIVQSIGPSLRALIIDFHPLPNRDWIGMAEEIISSIESMGFSPVISPNWSIGWTRAGSWIRKPPIPQLETFEPMMSGKICCGCGEKIDSEGKSLCSRCWSIWIPKHKKGYNKAK